MLIFFIFRQSIIRKGLCHNSLFLKHFCEVQLFILAKNKKKLAKLKKSLYHSLQVDARWSSLAARRAHNPKVVGSNPALATVFLSDTLLMIE